MQLAAGALARDGVRLLAGAKETVEIDQDYLSMFAFRTRNGFFTLIVLAMIVSTTNLRGRLPSSRTQLRAMDATNWIAASLNLCVGIFAICELYMYANAAPDTCFRLALVSMLGFVIVSGHLIAISIEQIRKIHVEKLARSRDVEYMCHVVVIGGFWLACVIFGYASAPRLTIAATCRMSLSVASLLMYLILALLAGGYITGRYIFPLLSTANRTLSRWCHRHIAGTLVMGGYLTAALVYLTFDPKILAKESSMMPFADLSLGACILSVLVVEGLIDLSPQYKTLHDLSGVDSQVTRNRGFVADALPDLEQTSSESHMLGAYGHGGPKLVAMAKSIAQMSMQASADKGSGKRKDSAEAAPKNHIIDPRELEAFVLGDDVAAIRSREASLTKLTRASTTDIHAIPVLGTLQPAVKSGISWQLNLYNAPVRSRPRVRIPEPDASSLDDRTFGATEEISVVSESPLWLTKTPTSGLGIVEVQESGIVVDNSRPRVIHQLQTHRLSIGVPRTPPPTSPPTSPLPTITFEMAAAREEMARGPAPLPRAPAILTKSPVSVTFDRPSILPERTRTPVSPASSTAPPPAWRRQRPPASTFGPVSYDAPRTETPTRDAFVDTRATASSGGSIHQSSGASDSFLSAKPVNRHSMLKPPSVAGSAHETSPRAIQPSRSSNSLASMAHVSRPSSALPSHRPMAHDAHDFHF